MQVTKRQRTLMHLQYEVESLRDLVPLVAEHDASGAGVLRNACLEAALVHARLLTEFLYGRPGECGCRHRSKQDLVPGDFVDDWEPNVPPKIDDWLKLMDRHLSHLSKQRASVVVEVDWDLEEIQRTLLDGYRELVELAQRQGKSGRRGAGRTPARSSRRRRLLR